MAQATRQRSRKRSTSDGDGDGQCERHREAAEDAIQQRDWCIGYLHGIRKSET